MKQMESDQFLIYFGLFHCPYICLCKSCRYNKREEDFPSLRDYNDYLEEVEDMSKKSSVKMGKYYAHPLYSEAMHD